jgi:hypothetical protein
MRSSRAALLATEATVTEAIATTVAVTVTIPTVVPMVAPMVLTAALMADMVVTELTQAVLPTAQHLLV